MQRITPFASLAVLALCACGGRVEVDTAPAGAGGHPTTGTATGASDGTDVTGGGTTNTTTVSSTTGTGGEGTGGSGGPECPDGVCYSCGAIITFEPCAIPPLACGAPVPDGSSSSGGPPSSYDTL